MSTPKSSLTKPSLFHLGLAVLFSVAIYPSALAQTPDAVPFARLLPSTASVTRPRRVIPATSAVETVETVNSSSPSFDEANPVERRAFEQTNQERIKNGLPPFAWDADLCRMARRHSENMARQGFFSHVSPDGSRLRDRAKAAGIVRFTIVGENIAYNLGYDDPGAFAVERWMLSPGHRANILYSGFHAMAVGTSVGPDGAVYLTQTFITR
jgi:uncharacterized protein YkwD